MLPMKPLWLVVAYMKLIMELMHWVFSLRLLVVGWVPSRVRNLYAPVYPWQHVMQELTACIRVLVPFLGCRVVLIL